MDQLKTEELPITEDELSEVLAVNYEELQDSMEKSLQLEFNCQTLTERVLAHAAIVNYIRYLKIQEELQECTGRLSALWYNHDSCKSDSFRPYSPNNACNRNKFELARYGVLSKEADRTFRQYLASINMLRMMKQPKLQVNVKADVANIAQNQQVQTNHFNHHETII